LPAARADVRGSRKQPNPELTGPQQADQASGGAGRVFLGLVGQVAREAARTGDATPAQNEGVLPQALTGHGKSLHRIAIERSPTKPAISGNLGLHDGASGPAAWALSFKWRERSPLLKSVAGPLDQLTFFFEGMSIFGGSPPSARGAQAVSQNAPPSGRSVRRARRTSGGRPRVRRGSSAPQPG